MIANKLETNFQTKFWLLKMISPLHSHGILEHQLLWAVRASLIIFDVLALGRSMAKYIIWILFLSLILGHVIWIP
jgi:hypothetical protein